MKEKKKRKSIVEQFDSEANLASRLRGVSVNGGNYKKQNKTKTALSVTCVEAKKKGDTIQPSSSDVDDDDAT